MKYSKALPISIASIILAAFLAVSFLVYDASESVAVKGVANTYAQTFANENKLEFITVSDSENDKVEIPIINESQYADALIKNNKNSKTLEKPKNVLAKTKSVNSISLTWDSVNNADKYVIYQVSASGTVKKIATTSSQSPTAYLIENLQPDNLYFYAVQAVSDNKKINNSKFSDVTFANTSKQNEEFAYNYEGDTVTITDYKGSDSEVIIPDTIDDLPVKALSMQVTGRGIDVVQIPESVTRIDSDFTTSRYTPDFFAVIAVMILGYAFALVSTFIGMKKAENAEGTFYGIPFVYSGLVTYIVITVWCSIALLLNLPLLLQVIIAIVIFAIAAAKLLKKSVARDIIEQRGEQVKAQTAFIKLLTADADSLRSRAKTDEAKELTKKVYEAIRYSDPMSVPELFDVEAQIQNEFNTFSEAIKTGDDDLATSIAEELINLIGDRNKKCKVLK